MNFEFPSVYRVCGTHGRFDYDRLSHAVSNIVDDSGNALDELPKAYRNIVSLDTAEYNYYYRHLSNFLRRPLQDFFPDTHDILLFGFWYDPDAEQSGLKRQYAPPEWRERFFTACELVGMADALNYTDPKNAAKFMLLVRSWYMCFPEEASVNGPLSHCKDGFEHLKTDVRSIWSYYRNRHHLKI